MYCQLDHSVSDGKIMCTGGKYLVSGAYTPPCETDISGLYIGLTKDIYTRLEQLHKSV